MIFEFLAQKIIDIFICIFHNFRCFHTAKLANNSYSSQTFLTIYLKKIGAYTRARPYKSISLFTLSVTPVSFLKLSSNTA